MTTSDTLMLLNMLMVIPLGIMTVILGHTVRTLNCLERRISHIEGRLH